MRFSISKKEGFQKNVISPENSDLRFISFSYLYAPAGLTFEENTCEQEWLWVILSGRIIIEAKGFQPFTLERKSVFEEKPVSIYLPKDTQYNVRVENFSEAIAVSAFADEKYKVVFISADSIKKQRAGKLNYQRTIFNLVAPNFPASKIIAGETIHDIGHWSCFPPHKHDVDQMPVESKHEELYFFKCEPEKTGFGMMRIYDETQDIAFPILTNDAITIPGGYHPVAVIPEHSLYYFWVLAGEKRPFQRHTHPDYVKYE